MATTVFNQDDYPEHVKLKAASSNSQAIGEFLDNSPYLLAEWAVNEDGDDVLQPVPKSIEQVLAAHFEIDLIEIEKEKRAMLELIRKGQ